MGGGQIGYSWQVNSFVIGLESDFQGSGIKSNAAGSIATDGIPVSLVSSEKLEWFGTLRGRLGVTVSPDLLLYATGGLAYGRVSNSANGLFTIGGTPFTFPGVASATKGGWAAGAGFEWMFARSWSAKVEYLYFDLGNISVNAPQIPANIDSITYDWKTQDHIIRAGVNYHF